MKNSLSFDQLNKKLFHILHRYHFVLFVVLVLGGMAIVIFLLNNTIRSSTDLDQTTVAPTSTGFDQATIDKLESLKSTPNNSQSLDFPNGRINPFVE